ncbi:unnamed protein product [Gordionus sp. m RMFG-2023]
MDESHIKNNQKIITKDDVLQAERKLQLISLEYLLKSENVMQEKFLDHEKILEDTIKKIEDTLNGNLENEIDKLNQISRQPIGGNLKKMFIDIQNTSQQMNLSNQICVYEDWSGLAYVQRPNQNIASLSELSIKFKEPEQSSDYEKSNILENEYAASKNMNGIISLN